MYGTLEVIKLTTKPRKCYVLRSLTCRMGMFRKLTKVRGIHSCFVFSSELITGSLGSLYCTNNCGLPLENQTWSYKGTAERRVILKMTWNWQHCEPKLDNNGAQKRRTMVLRVLKLQSAYNSVDTICGNQDNCEN
jgi:hypothetical protein